METTKARTTVTLSIHQRQLNFFLLYWIYLLPGIRRVSYITWEVVSHGTATYFCNLFAFRVFLYMRNYTFHASCKLRNLFLTMSIERSIFPSNLRIPQGWCQVCMYLVGSPHGDPTKYHTRLLDSSPCSVLYFYIISGRSTSRLYRLYPGGSSDLPLTVGLDILCCGLSAVLGRESLKLQWISPVSYFF